MNTRTSKIPLFVLICMLLCSSVVYSQDLMVYHVVGDVAKMVSGEKQSVTMNTHLCADTEVIIPYGGKLELLDEASSQRIILSKPGSSTVEKMMASNDNTITKLSKNYVAYIKKQMNNKGLTVKQRYTDFACVTREIDSVPQRELTMEERFNMFKASQDEKFNSFREKCNKKYADFVRKAWQKFDRMQAVAAPKDQKTVPIVAPEVTPDTAPEKERKEHKVEQEIVVDKSIEEPPVQPEPVEPIAEVEESEQDKEFCNMPFEFFGTELNVRLDESRRIHVGEINPDRIADALLHFSTEAYDNLLYDCLQIRKERKLCDWAYLLMLKELTDQFCGEGTNEATLMLGYLYYQSGYKIRFATDNVKLYVLIASNHLIYNSCSYEVDGEIFYALEDIESDLFICQASFPKEKTLSLYIPQQPIFDINNEEEREIRSKRYSDISLRFKVNKNIVNFYGSYPSSCVDDDFTTRWAMYAETPMDTFVKNQIYPVLSEKLKGLSELQAVERLLNLVQTGLEYEFDENVWGADRVFFAEESLHYPFCDCEDRSILFTRLVRDLLNIECALIYYPGHLAAAVKFKELPGGTYYTTQDGEKYTVCDPTYINASVGEPIPSLENEPVTLIKLK